MAKNERRTIDLPAIPTQLRLQIRYHPINLLRAYRRHARSHPKKQIRKLRESIEGFGFIVPILIEEDGTVIAGHARVIAAEGLGQVEVPCVTLTHLNDDQVRALRIADNRLTELAEWDSDRLAVELEYLVDIDFQVELTGFESPEIDLIIGDNPSEDASGANAIPVRDEHGEPVALLGDHWILDQHHLVCGDARDPADYRTLLGGEVAQMVFTDPPYNVRIDGHVCGAGSIRHPEFLMASGEMTDAEFECFLDICIENFAQFSADGSVHYVCIDWRHVSLLETVVSRRYSSLLNICVWAKSNGGMGSLYRSQHELVLVAKNGTGPHINNVQLGRFGRNRTNVWHYDGVNTLHRDRRNELTLHPTVKPVALVADAIKDCSKRRGAILDPFLGSGTTLIAAEQTARRCFGMELDPKYLDVAIRRWENFTGSTALNARTGMSFEETQLAGRREIPALPELGAREGFR